MNPLGELLLQGMDVRLVDCEFMKASEVAALVKECQGFAIGSPTLGGKLEGPKERREMGNDDGFHRVVYVYPRAVPYFISAPFTDPHDSDIWTFWPSDR
jgi:hypothetical protein